MVSLRSLVGDIGLATIVVDGCVYTTHNTIQTEFETVGAAILGTYLNAQLGKTRFSFFLFPSFHPSANWGLFIGLPQEINGEVSNQTEPISIFPPP